MIGRDNSTPLHIAVERDDTNMVSYLLGVGADIEARRRTGYVLSFEGGLRPIHIAVQRNNLTMLRLILNHHANINSQGEDGRTALLEAALYGHQELIKELIHRQVNVKVTGVSPNCFQAASHLLLDGYGRTALHYAAVRGNYAIVEMLIEGGVDIDAQRMYFMHGFRGFLG